MSHPVVCGFTNLAIESGDEVGLMVIRTTKFPQATWRPFECFVPITRLVFGEYCDDGLVYVSKEQEHIMRSSFDEIPLNDSRFPFDDETKKYLESEIFQEEGCISVSGYQCEYFPWFIRKDVYDNLLPNLICDDYQKDAEFEHTSRMSKYEKDLYKELCDKFAEIVELSEKYADNEEHKQLFISMKTYEIERFFDFGEGVYIPSINAIKAKLKAEFLVKGAFKLDNFLAISEPLFEVNRIYSALSLGRRGLYPHYSIGPQFENWDNPLLIANFVKKHCEAEKATRKAEEAEENAAERCGNAEIRNLGSKEFYF